MEKKFEAYQKLLDGFRAEARLRAIPGSLRDGAIDFCSNDYMGLAALNQRTNPHTPSESSALQTSSSSRLLCSHQSEYKSLEALMESLYGKPALLFNSGYHANTGTVSALAALPGTLIVSDKLVHASIIDGIRLSKSRFERFRHNDICHLKKILDANKDAERILVITESIFSMDGDEAPILQLVELKKVYPNLILYVDEAHAFGVRGENGLGLCEELGVIQDIDVLVGTFGKAAASMGAFVISSQLIKDVLINTARSFIFSTALPPEVIVNAERNVRMLSGMQKERERLAKLSKKLRDGIAALGAEMPSVSQIVPWIVNDAALASEYSKELRERGFNVLPIRKPTVPAGTERLRFSVCASQTEEDIDRLLITINEIKR